jgi:hypothetical protein
LIRLIAKNHRGFSAGDDLAELIAMQKRAPELASQLRQICDK